MAERIPAWVKDASVPVPARMVSLALKWGDGLRSGALRMTYVEKEEGLSNYERRMLSKLVHGRTAHPIPGGATAADVSVDAPAEFKDTANKSERQGDVVNPLLYAQGENIRTLDDVFKAHDLDPDEYQVIDVTTKDYQGFMKNKHTQKPLVIQLAGIKVRLERRFGPLRMPAVAPAKLPRVIKHDSKRIKTALVIPDSQHGYRWNRTHSYLEPLHDRIAFDAVVQYAEQLQPDVVIILGDMLDLAPWSKKYPRPYDLVDTTTPAVWELHWQLSQLRLACPHARIVYLEGNHELRIRKYLIDSLPEADTLIAANDDRKLMDMRNVLDLDALDIEYIQPYGSLFWLWDRVVATHGDIAKKGAGTTAAAVLKDSVASIVYGHIHKNERVSKTIQTPQGQKIITAMSPGCLCRLVPGLVPGFKHHQNWQQGCGTIRWDRDTDGVFMDLHEIHNGVLIADNQLILGRDRSGEIAEFTGYAQIATP